MAKMDAAAYMKRADEYGSKGNYELALSNMKIAVAMDPNNVEHREKLERLFVFIEGKSNPPDFGSTRKSTPIAYLLFVFLGLFGIHQFYIGNIVSGAWRLILLFVIIFFPFEGTWASVLYIICALTVIVFWGKDLITLGKQVCSTSTRIYFIPVIRFLFNGIYNIPVIGSICSFVRGVIDIILRGIKMIIPRINGVFGGAIVGTIVGSIGGIVIIFIGYNMGGIGGLIVSAIGILLAVIFGINGGISGGTSDESL